MKEKRSRVFCFFYYKIRKFMRKVSVDGRKLRFEDVEERLLDSSMAFDCRL